MEQAVARAVAILEVLARAPAPVRLTRLAAEVALQKSTVHRLLKTWTELGYVRQEAETGRYELTLRLWELGSAVAVEHPVKRAVSGFLQALHRETGETVSLLLRDGDDVLYLDKLFSPRSVRFSTRPGSRVAAPLTAGGRALLAHDPEAAAVVARFAAARDGADPAVLLAELAAARAKGYSVSDADGGGVSYGCALPARSGPPTAALSVSIPAERRSAAHDAGVLEALRSTVAKVCESVGTL